MSNSIKISPKHGVNPTIPVCFYCGEPKNEIALLGKIGGRGEDLEAPKHLVIDYEPCDKCKEMWQQGVPLVEAVSSYYIKDNRPPIQEDKATGTLLYPTGRCVVLKIEAARRLFNIPESQIGLGKVLLIDREVFSQIVGDTK